MCLIFLIFFFFFNSDLPTPFGFSVNVTWSNSAACRGIINAFWEIKGRNQNIITLWKGRGTFSFQESLNSTQKNSSNASFWQNLVFSACVGYSFIPSLDSWGCATFSHSSMGILATALSLLSLQQCFVPSPFLRSKTSFWWRDLAPDPLIVICVPFLLWEMHNHCNGKKKMMAFGGSRGGRGQHLTASDPVF